MQPYDTVVCGQPSSCLGPTPSMNPNPDFEPLKGCHHSISIWSQTLTQSLFLPLGMALLILPGSTLQPPFNKQGGRARHQTILLMASRVTLTLSHGLERMPCCECLLSLPSLPTPSPFVVYDSGHSVFMDLTWCHPLIGCARGTQPCPQPIRYAVNCPDT